MIALMVVAVAVVVGMGILRTGWEARTSVLVTLLRDIITVLVITGFFHHFQQTNGISVRGIKQSVKGGSSGVCERNGRSWIPLWYRVFALMNDGLM